MTTNFCPSCGAAVPPGGTFCGNCGTATGRTSSLTGSTVAATDPAYPVGGAPEVFLVGTTTPVPDPPRPLIGRPPQQTRSWDGDVVTATVGIRFVALILDAVPPVVLVLLAVTILEPGIPVLSVAAVPLGYAVLLLAMMATRGSSPGKAVVGIRVVRAGDGSPPGWGIAFARYFLRGILMGVTFDIAGLSPFWDPARRNRAWWDRAVDTLVVHRSSLGGGESRLPAPVHPGASSAPTRPGTAGSPPPPPPSPVPMPAWNSPVPLPAPVSVAPVVSATWDDRPARPEAIEADVPPAPAGDLAAVPWAADRVGPAGLVVAVPGFRPSEVPGSGAASTLAPGASSSPQEHTRLGPSSARTAPRWQLTIDDGRRIDLVDSLLIGRDPHRAAGGPEVLVLPDESRSVSKTHLLVELVDGEVWVTDWRSTNGVSVDSYSGSTTCSPGQRTSVPDGATVRFGDRELTVRRSN